MIDKEQFVAGMTALAGAFGREIDGAVQKMYYGILSQHMTTEEFKRAIDITLVTETYWPSPAVLLNKVKADQHSRALSAFEHVNRITAAAGGYKLLPHTRYLEEFDAATRSAISEVGGLSAIANTSEERWPTLQRRFTTAYASFLEPAKALPATGTDGRVQQLIKGTARNLAIVPDYKARQAGEHDDE
jgi:hypothetical protein